jgi:hypothetical protein
MRATSLRRRVVHVLEARARLLLGPTASAIEYVERWVEAGLSLVVLTRAIAVDLRYPVSRGFVTFACQRLTPDARHRIKAARRRGRSATMPPFVAELRCVERASARAEAATAGSAAMSDV